MHLHPMSVLGLSSVEEDVYRHLLRNPGLELDDLHLLLRQDAQTVASAVDRLLVLQALRRDEDGTAWPHKPDLVVNRLAQQRLEDLYDTIRALSDLRPLLDSLADEVRAPAADATESTVERLMGLRAIRDRLDELAFFARAEVLAAEPYDALTRENIEHSRPLDMRCLRRGVVLRSLIRGSALEDDTTRSYLQELVAAGARIRVVKDLDELMVVYDRRTALIPVDPQNTAKGALCSSEAGIVTTIVNNFERLWAAAEEFSDAIEARGGDPSGRDALSDLQLQILRAMCTAGKDETGARSVGVALRTYRRHISDLLRALGADNRAQAALLARERRWI
ncbi:helix-turn-helix transcriptional regulator [Streptomyces sp. NPDC056600]|uniref:helix-turn-helix transcriptional regulator n=1 Tax=Streptomyces sp. NPDC056600 TaxID=3345874 RepID=UPI003684B9DD